MRKSWFALKTAFLSTAILVSSFAADSSTAVATSSKNKSATAKSPPPKTSTTPCTGDGRSGEKITLNVLDGTGADALAQALSSVFSGFIVTSEADQQTNPKASKQSTTPPTADSTSDPAASGKSGKAAVPKHICVFDAAGHKPSPPLPNTDLGKIVKEFDHDNFKGVELNSNYIIPVPAPTPIDFYDGLILPTTKLTLKLIGRNPAGENYLLLLPSPETIGQPSAVSALATQVSGIKHDLLWLGNQMKLANNRSDQDAAGALARDLLTNKPETATMETEKWLQKHTIRLQALDPREVLLTFGDYFESYYRKLNVLLKQQSIAVLPAGAGDASAGLLAGEAIERDVLYRRNLAEKSAQQQAGSAKSSKPDSTPAPGTTTTNSTTKTSVTSGTTKGPTTETSTVTTVTSPPAAAAASGTGQEKSASSNSGSGQTQGGSSATTQNSSGGQSDGAQSASQSQGSTPVLKSWPIDQPFPMDRVQRLYHFRHAKDIAAAINKASGSKDDLVEAFGENDDLLLILPPSTPNGHDPFSDIRRAIATIDLPRPQLSLQVWSYQISSKVKNDDSRANEVQRSFLAVRRRVLTANDRMTLALQDGFGTLLDRVARLGRHDFFDHAFADYLTMRYQDCINEDHYCLGFYRALQAPESWAAGNRVMDASLSRMFLFLVAAHDAEASGTMEAMVNAMEDRRCVGHAGLYHAHLPDEAALCFSRFRSQLRTLVLPRNLHILRAALLDFFFQYKQVYVYFNDFIPYDLQRTAHEVDDLFNPVVNAFNQDVDEFVTQTMETVSCEKDDAQDTCSDQKAKGLVSKGMVQVSALSGTPAQVSGKVNNYFDITPPMSLSDILNPNQNAATALKNVLEPKEITLLTAVANMGSQPKIQAQVSRGMTLTVTPTALDTASSAELEVSLDVGEPTGAPPGSVNSAITQADILNRVADHQVTTNVRVESLKLFEVSSFTMELTHPQRPMAIPVIGQAWEGLFGTMPVADRLFHIPLNPTKIDNRSIAIIRAVVVPTAMDFGESMGFESDRVWDPSTDSTDPMFSVQQIGGRIRPFHKHLMTCITSGTDGCWGRTPNGVKLSATLEDQR
jgi:hypothetical protein